MVKRLLSIAAVAAVAANVNAAAPYVLSLEDLNAGWSSTYSAETKTITYEGDWTGRGWGFYDVNFDATNYTDVEIKFAKCNVPGQIIVQYGQLVYDAEGNVVQEWGSDKHEQSSKSFNAGDEGVTCKLNDEYKNAIVQIYLQCGSISGIESPTIELESAEIVDNSDAPINYTVYEGEATPLNWWPGMSIPTDFFPLLVEGTKIDITFTDITDPEGACFKLQTINFDWSQTWLPGVALINGAAVAEDKSDVHAPIVAGTISCPITAEDVALINTAGVQQIMLVGAGASVTKIEIIPVGSGVNAIETEANEAPVYYNISGMQINNPTQGLYIVKRGNKVTKEIIR